MMEVKQGNASCLGILYERYKRILFTFFYHLNHDRELSEDLVQNVFMRILKYKNTYTANGTFKAWLFHIARNVNADHYRKNSRLSERTLKERDEESVGEWPLFSEEQNMEEVVLERAFEQLDQDKKEVLLLSKYQNRKYKDIGKILNCSEGAVKVKVCRAVQALKENYEELAARIN